MSVKAEKEGGLCFWTAFFPNALLGNLDITQPHTLYVNVLWYKKGIRKYYSISAKGTKPWVLF